MRTVSDVVERHKTHMFSVEVARGTAAFLDAVASACGSPVITLKLPPPTVAIFLDDGRGEGGITAKVPTYGIEEEDEYEG